MSNNLLLNIFKYCLENFWWVPQSSSQCFLLTSNRIFKEIQTARPSILFLKFNIDPFSRMKSLDNTGSFTINFAGDLIGPIFRRYNVITVRSFIQVLSKILAPSRFQRRSQFFLKSLVDKGNNLFLTCLGIIVPYSILMDITFVSAALSVLNSSIWTRESLYGPFHIFHKGSCICSVHSYYDHSRKDLNWHLFLLIQSSSSIWLNLLSIRSFYVRLLTICFPALFWSSPPGQWNCSILNCCNAVAV